MDILDVEINQKNYIKILSICVLVVLLIIGIYYAVLLIPKSYTPEKETKVAAFEEEKDLVVHIDVLSPGRIVEIVGYAYLTDDEVFTVDCSYVLRNTNSKKMYLVKTIHEKNVNVPEVYPYAGMHTQFLTLGMEKGNYEICLLYKNNENNFLKDTGIRVDI